jgi:hypothetical protein
MSENLKSVDQTPTSPENIRFSALPGKPVWGYSAAGGLPTVPQRASAAFAVAKWGTFFVWRQRDWTAGIEAHAAKGYPGWGDVPRSSRPKGDTG